MHKVSILTPHIASPDGTVTAASNPVLAMVQVDSIETLFGTEKILAKELGVTALKSVGAVYGYAAGIYGGLPCVVDNARAWFQNDKPFPDGTTPNTEFFVAFTFSSADSSGRDVKRVQSLIQPAFALIMATWGN